MEASSTEEERSFTREILSPMKTRFGLYQKKTRDISFFAILNPSILVEFCYVFISNRRFFWGGDANAEALEARKIYDPASTRGLILPSAETLNKGEFTLSSIEIFFFNVSYGITDRAMVSFTSVVPLFPETPFVGLLSLKYKLISKPRWSLSLQPNTLVLPFDSDGGMFGVQVISDIALTDDGAWVLTLAANPQIVFASFDDGSPIEVSSGAAGLLGASIEGQLHRRLKLMGEVFVPGSISFETGDSQIITEDFMISLVVSY